MQSNVLVGSNGNTLWCKRADDDTEAARLEREVAVLDELDGAGVIELVAAGDAQFTSVIVGVRHLGSMARSGQLTRAAAESALAALDEIHRMGWRHGNLTLDHAVMGASGRVRWCSLGAAQRVDSPNDPAARRERDALLLVLSDAGIERLNRARSAKRPGAPMAPPPTGPLRASARRRRELVTLLGQVLLFASIAAIAYWSVASLDTSTTLGLMALWLGRLVLVASGYGVVVTVVAAVALWRHHDAVAAAAQRWVPRWLRWGAAGSAAISLGGAVMGTTPAPSVTAPTTAAPTTAAPTTAAPTTAATTTTTLARLPPAPATAGPDDAPRPPPDGVTVVVSIGDHLWGIARTALTANLGRPPTDAEVAPYWRDLIDANRDRLADPDNPDLIFAGQEIILPSR